MIKAVYESVTEGVLKEGMEYCALRDWEYLGAYPGWQPVPDYVFGNAISNYPEYEFRRPVEVRLEQGRLIPIPKLEPILVPEEEEV